VPLALMVQMELMERLEQQVLLVLMVKQFLMELQHQVRVLVLMVIFTLTLQLI
jgi:hypothetical protein